MTSWNCSDRRGSATAPLGNEAGGRGWTEGKPRSAFGMRRCSSAVVPLGIALVLALAAVGRGEDPFVRSGNPHCIAPWADFGINQKYCGYYLGGGARVGQGEGRYSHEGTWGVDYLPWRRTRVALHWWHGRKFQDGGGQYEPDARNNPFDSLVRDHTTEHP